MLRSDAVSTEYSHDPASHPGAAPIMTGSADKLKSYVRMQNARPTYQTHNGLDASIYDDLQPYFAEFKGRIALGKSWQKHHHRSVDLNSNLHLNHSSLNFILDPVTCWEVVAPVSLRKVIPTDSKFEQVATTDKNIVFCIDYRPCHTFPLVNAPIGGSLRILREAIQAPEAHLFKDSTESSAYLPFR